MEQGKAPEVPTSEASTHWDEYVLECFRISIFFLVMPCMVLR